MNLAVIAYVLQVTQGSCDRSFGIHVARLAHFPAHIVTEAESLANALENGEPLSAHFTSRQPANNGQPGVRSEELSAGPKRKITDVADVDSSVSEGPAEKRSC